MKIRLKRIDPAIKKRLSEQWNNIRINDDFIFCKVMQNKRILARLIRLILPELEFKNISIQPQKSIEIGRDIHGVRFDVYVTLNDGTIVDIEMQVLNHEYLPKRLRYYGSISDMDLLEKGCVYSKLRDSYVIMICPFDMFGKGRHVYTFTNRCREDLSLELGDGTTKIVLNATGTADDVNDGLKAFLDYIAGKPVHDKYIDEIDAAVTRAKMNKKWRAQYMTLMMRDLENRELGINQGIKQGIEQGIEQGIKQEKKNTDLAKNNGVRAVICACKKLGGSPTDAIEMVVMNMGMSKEKAEEKVKMYW